MHRSAGAVALLCVTLVCACSQKDSAKPDSTKVAQAGTTAAASGSYDPTTKIAIIHAKDFAFAAPDSIPAGWTGFVFMNEGQTLHHVQIARLDSGKTVADLQAAMKNPGPPPSWLGFVGGPNAPDPGGQSNAMLNLQPGNYVLLCFVDTPDHVPHFAKGMIRPLLVTAATGTPGTEPVADATITLADYSFTVKGTLNAGRHTFKILNKGPQAHEIELIRFAPGKTAKDLIAWVAKFDGPPPGSAIGGVSGIGTGITSYVNIELTPGNYGFICFYPDAKDGKPHFEHGMVKEFTVN